MNPKYFGDSYDIVKRFFVECLKEVGYCVLAVPMFTGEWNGLEHSYFKFIGAHPVGTPGNEKSALLLDPDTGIKENRTPKHVTVDIIASHLKTHEIVFTFDQSFSRSGDPRLKMKEKLSWLDETSNLGFYYDSHAKFLFASNSKDQLGRVKEKLISSGIPEYRLIAN